MKNRLVPKKKTMFTARVQSNEPVGRCYHKMTIELDKAGSEAFIDLVPGQFAEFDLRNLSLPPKEAIPAELADVSQRQVILRRPFSFYDSTTIQNTSPPIIRLGILYWILGPVTLRMTTLSKGDQINMIGPLGNGFWVPEGTKRALIIAGGIGAPPLIHLADYLHDKYPQIEKIAFAGTKSIEHMPVTIQIDNEVGATIAEFSRYKIETYIATDDGSVGHRGFVTECLKNWINENKHDIDNTVIYACGPKPMLAAVSVIAADHNIQCQVSMEEMMACGIGICQSCAVETKADSNETQYKLCCKDGPVFDSRQIVLDL